MTTEPHRQETNGSPANAVDSRAEDYRGAPDPLTAPTQPAGGEAYAQNATQEPDRSAATQQPYPQSATQESDTAASVGHGRVEQPHTRGTQPETSTDGALFETAELTGLRSRWNDIQAGFVDDPRKCVQSADGLVSDVVQQLTNSFSNARSNLEEQWARGENISTEDLRLALKRYREFFEKMLAI
jgi:hypothetical protein